MSTSAASTCFVEDAPSRGRGHQRGGRRFEDSLQAACGEPLLDVGEMRRRGAQMRFGEDGHAADGRERLCGGHWPVSYLTA